MDDWEVIEDSSNTISYLDGIENGIIMSDHFSLDSHHTNSNHILEDQISDNPSWIDPVSDTITKPITGTWTTDGSDEFEASECEKTESEIGNIEEEKMMERNRWCKLPLDLLKYCLFKASPVSIAAAAAMMGVLILGRRFYKMKQKTTTLQLTLDDKKVSQVMSRAARLSEAFTVLKRAPIIRPSLPVAAGIAPWPMMALR